MTKKVCQVCDEMFEGHYKRLTCDDCLDEGLQFCTSCEEVLPLDDFYFNTNRGKHMVICKECQTNKTTKHHQQKCATDAEYHEKSLTRRREYHKECLRDPGWKEERNRKAKEWREEFLISDPGYQDRCNAYGHKYRANLRGSYTADEWMSCLEANDYKCAYCGSEHNLTVDHIVAVSEGGWNYAFNLTVACQSCNSSKQASEIVEWYSKQPFYDETKLRNIHKRYRVLQQQLLANIGGDLNE